MIENIFVIVMVRRYVIISWGIPTYMYLEKKFLVKA